MKFARAALSASHLWASPFVRWQGALADVSSLDLAVAVTRAALAERRFDADWANHFVLGTTIPQHHGFYAAPWVAARLGAPGLGAHLSQACATSVACLVSAASAVELGPGTRSLVVTADRTSNGPLIVYPRPHAMGGSPATETWVLDNFAADPWTRLSMLDTAEAVAREGAMTRAALDALTLLRFDQYRAALAAASRPRYLQPIVVEQGKRKLVIEADQGVHEYSADGMAQLRPARPGGLITPGHQTHPADGTGGAIVQDLEGARDAAKGEGVVRLLSATFVRVEPARMPKAGTSAALRALDEAGFAMRDVAAVTTHNPFAVNDLWFAKQTGFPLERMNVRGCSLIYGHPQAPTGMRAIAELVETLRARGGGIGVFAGCAAGDTGTSLVLRVE